MNFQDVQQVQFRVELAGQLAGVTQGVLGMRAEIGRVQDGGESDHR
jgi:hypothetical protein